MSSFSHRRMDGKVAIVTGSSSGIGEATALLFAQKGACVTLCGRNQGRLDTLKKKCAQISGHPERFMIVSGDLTDPSIRTKTLETTVQTFGQLDILVANAGEATKPGSFLEESEENWDKTVALLVKSVVFLIQEAMPHLETTKGVIVISSGIHAVPGAWVYNCLKESLNLMVKFLGIAYGSKGIRVNAACPGYTANTRILRSFGNQADKMSQQLTQDVSSRIPLEGRVATVREQSDVIAFLASGESSYLTGETIAVDGMMGKYVPGLDYNIYSE